ncbi:MAG: ATP-binding protein [Oscillospiraceae bacterium]|nr:ATP-binding protein [Oscillospiraceae bacterium]
MGDNKKTYVKMRSIARKIAADASLKYIRIFIFINLLFTAVRAFSWQIVTEAGIFGYDLSHFWTIRPQGSFICSKVKTVSEFIGNLQYIVPGCDEAVSASGLVSETIIMLSVLTAGETAVLIFNIFLGPRKIRRRLNPLKELACSAERISHANFEMDKFHDLEDALDKIETVNDDCMIHTGNTELKGLEDAVNGLIERMRNSYIEQARFVSDASHELRTPISVIQGYANMLDRWGKDDEKILDESISAIKSESEAMSRLIEQLLFLARGDNGRNTLNFEHIDLCKMMHEIYDEYVMVDSAHKYILDLGDNKSICAFGDYSMLKQTVRIITDNAVKYTPHGNTIKFRAFMRDDIACFEIQDSGIGIPEKDINRIFERFYRADDARNRKTGGTGLGLSIAKWIVDRHDGYINVISVPDVGSSFTVYLPQNESEETINEEKC